MEPSSTHDVCLVTNLYPPEVIGGAERHASADARTLADRGHRVSVVTTVASGPRTTFRVEEDDHVTVYRFTPYNAYAPIEHRDEPFWKKPIQHVVDLWNPHVYRMLRRKLAEIDPDIVHVHNYAGLSPATFRAASRVDAAVVHTLHDYHAIALRSNLYVRGSAVEPGLLSAPYRWWYRSRVEPYVDHVVAPSRFVIDVHRRNGLFQEAPATVTTLGTELADRVDPPDPSEQDLPGPDRPLRLLYVGRLSEAKGVHLAVDAVSSLDDVLLDVVGTGPELDSLRDRSAGDESVTVHGYVAEEALSGFYERADFVVVPSTWYDNAHLVIYESYAHGTPVIGADIGGIPEAIEPGTTGYTFEPGSVESLASTITAARADLSVEYLEAFREKDVSIGSHVDDLLDVYSSLSPSSSNDDSP